MRLALIVVSALGVGACGHHNPTAPDGVRAVVTGLGITGADEVPSGADSQYTATAVFSDGTTRVVAPSWGTSDPAVAVVESNGHVVGRNRGAFTLTASYAGRDVSKTVRVINNYSGRWTGQKRLTRCDASGDLKAFGCRAAGTPGISLLTIKVTQGTSNPRDVIVSGLDLHGSVTDDGPLTVSGSMQLVDDDGVTVVAILESRWDIDLSAADNVAGRVYDDYKYIVPAGTLRAEYELTLTRLPAIGSWDYATKKRR